MTSEALDYSRSVRPTIWPHRSLQRLLHAPDVEVMLLVVVARDEDVLVAALGMDVVLGHQIGRLDEAARRRVVEGAVSISTKLTEGTLRDQP